MDIETSTYLGFANGAQMKFTCPKEMEYRVSEDGMLICDFVGVDTFNHGGVVLEKVNGNT